MKNKIKIICVLRSGGVFTEAYVLNLYKALKRHITSEDWDMVCFTDVSFHAPGIEIIPLEFGFPGWWSKLEIFKYTGPCLYLDLDTLIMSDISGVLSEIEGIDENTFWMMEDFNGKELASGIMAWNGNWSILLKEFDGKFNGWDQRYIATKLKALMEPSDSLIQVDTVQNHLKGVYSYKMHCKGKCPSDVSVVCFHGKPKPHEILWLIWVRRAWAGD